MKRPIESDYTSFVAYARALEQYCDEAEKQEPVGWMDSKLNPIKREWVGLTDDEMYQLAQQVGFDAELMQRNHDKGIPAIAEHFARAIESKLKEKNNG